MLEHDAAVGAGAGDRLAVDADGAGFHREKAADQVEQCRLAAAGRAEQRDEFAILHLERHLVERQHFAPARRTIDVADAVDDDLGGPGHGRCSLPNGCNLSSAIGAVAERGLPYNAGKQADYVREETP